MNEQEFKEAFSDKKFVDGLLRLKTGEQVRKALKRKGIILTTEELDKFAEVLVKALEGNKISDEEIENCSGGANDFGVSFDKNGDINNDMDKNATIGAKVLAGFVKLDSLPSDSFWMNRR